jgi:N-acetylglucosamine-6-phosphate deacetylase
VLGAPELGRLVVGGTADVVVLDDALHVVRTLVAGETRVAS